MWLLIFSTMKMIRQKSLFTEFRPPRFSTPCLGPKARAETSDVFIEDAVPDHGNGFMLPITANDQLLGSDDNKIRAFISSSRLNLNASNWVVMTWNAFKCSGTDLPSAILNSNRRRTRCNFVWVGGFSYVLASAPS